MNVFAGSSFYRRPHKAIRTAAASLQRCPRCLRSAPANRALSDDGACGALLAHAVLREAVADLYTDQSDLVTCVALPLLLSLLEHVASGSAVDWTLLTAYAEQQGHAAPALPRDGACAALLERWPARLWEGGVRVFLEAEGFLPRSACAVPPAPPVSFSRACVSRENERPSCCAVCRIVQANTVLVPCGHLCMCYSCVECFVRRGGRACPLCRAAITHAAEVCIV